MRSRSSGVVVATVAVLAGTAPVAPASAPSCAGVLVVVDPGPLGGEVRDSCVRDAGGSAAQVMADSGITVTYTEGQPFVCRIDGVPGSDREDCRGTPPGDAYWGLFWSDGTADRWRYSTLGLAALDVPAGGAVGWRFQDGTGRQEPRATPALTSTRTAASDASAPRTVDPDDRGALTWAAGGAVLLLAAAAGVLALRRRS
ncbi:MAG TPA: hypothetical protein VFG72_10955 [Marmoricola sp.]|nr:hypothetical protein [Marmoricola sp.]